MTYKKYSKEYNVPIVVDQLEPIRVNKTDKSSNWELTVSIE